MRSSTKRLTGAVDVHVDAERHVVVVVDGDEALADQRAIGGVFSGRRIRQGRGRNALGFIDAVGAEPHVDVAGAVKDVVDKIVVVADDRRHAHDKLGIGARFVALVDRLVMPPQGIAGRALEDADHALQADRRALCVGDRYVEKGRAGRTVLARPKPGREHAEAVFADVHVGRGTTRLVPGPCRARTSRWPRADRRSRASCHGRRNGSATAPRLTSDRGGHGTTNCPSAPRRP